MKDIYIYLTYINSLKSSDTYMSVSLKKSYL